MGRFRPRKAAGDQAAAERLGARIAAQLVARLVGIWPGRLLVLVRP